MREASDHCVATKALATTATTPAVKLNDPTGKDSTVGLESLANHGKAEHIGSSEGSHAWTASRPAR